MRAMFFPRSGQPIKRAVLVRGGVALGCLLLTTILVYLGRYGYYDSQNPGEPITWLNAFYFATVSLSTTGYGDIVPATAITRFISAALITPLRVIFLIVLVGSTLEVLTKRTTAEYRENRWRKKVNHHTVIIGFGVKGRAAAQTLIDNGIRPEQILVISPVHTEVADAAELGCVGITGDARRDDVLNRAVVSKADRVIIAVDADDKSVLITLSVRRMTPSASIVASVREARNTGILRQSGANSVITTAEAAGRLMGISLTSPTAGSIMEDLLDPGEGLEVCERTVTLAEVGTHVGELANQGEIVLAVIRAGQTYRFDDRESRVLESGDRIVAIRHA